jgi:hypothetical protein
MAEELLEAERRKSENRDRRQAHEQRRPERPPSIPDHDACSRADQPNCAGDCDASSGATDGASAFPFI